MRNLPLTKLANVDRKTANDISDQPHRVIFKGRHSGTITTRVFANLAIATEFAISDQVKELIMVQPASDPLPPQFTKKHLPFKDEHTKKVPCEKCNGKKFRRSADPHCYECSGQHYRDYVNERVMKRKNRP